MRHNDNIIHASGNGKIIAYGHGADIIQIFGAPYSSPSLGTVKVESVDIFNTERRNETDIYTHESDTFIIKDFCDAIKPVFIRQIKPKNKINNELKLKLNFNDYVNIKDISFKYDKNVVVLQAVINSTAPVFFYYPVMRPIYYNIVLNSRTGRIKIEGNKVEFSLQDGILMFIGGPEYPDCSENTKYALNTDINEIEQGSIKRWQEFFERTNNYKTLSPTVPMRDDLLKAIEGVKIAIKTQQDLSGGVLAGYPYHLGYVRDQFGVVKGMLKLGMNNEAKELLNYFYNEFNRTGSIANAQGLGLNGVKHIHENDLVEITGYIILMFMECFKVIDVNEKKTWLIKILPMLEWALKAQCSQIIDGMIPFNGDETYIAGGILPRNTIYHGSSEATIIFIDSAKRLIKTVDEYSLSFVGDRKYYEACINECEIKFKDNFISDGKLVTNNPNRDILNKEKIPKYRHGVCEGYCGYFGWLQRGKSLYLCTDCLKKEFESKNPTEDNLTRYYLKSVLLLPIFINSEVVTINDIKSELEEIANNYKKTKSLPSRPDSTVSLGYDFGFLLNALNKTSEFKDIALELYKDTLNIVDETYTWSEYYNNNKPAGTMFRPWESGINIAVLIEYAERHGDIKS